MQAISIIKFDPSNNIIWDKLISSTKGKNLQPFSIAMSICGSIWVCGTMDSMDINIDGHLLATPLRSSDPVFIAGFNSNGTYISSAAASSGGDDLNRIACDHFGNVYLCSDYGALKNFILGNDTLPAGGEFLYLAKYKYLNIGSPISEYSSKTVCLEKDTIMQAISGYSNYIWSDGHIGQTHGVFDTGTFLVNGFDSCASFAMDTFIVTRCDCNKALFVPNAFTPNGDGQDDIFYPRSAPGIDKIKSFRVYNRWGEVVFNRENILPNDATNAWDGTYKGVRSLPDVFVWVVDAVCENGSIINKKGSVTIIR